MIRAPFDEGLAERGRAARAAASRRARLGAGDRGRAAPASTGRADCPMPPTRPAAVLMATVAVGRRSAAIARQTTDRAMLARLPRAGPAVRGVRDLRPRGARVRPDPLGRRLRRRRARGRRPRVHRPDAAAAVRHGPARRDQRGPARRHPAARRLHRRPHDDAAGRRGPLPRRPGPQMVRMWVDRARFRPYPATVQRLLPVEIGELNRLYQLGFASWLPSRRHRRRRLLRDAGQRPARGGRRHPRRQPGGAARGRRQRADPRRLSVAAASRRP